MIFLPIPLILITPLYQNKSWLLAITYWFTKLLNSELLRSPWNVRPTEEIVVSCWWSSSFKKSGSIFRILSMLNPLISRILLRSITEFWISMISTTPLTALIFNLILTKSSGETKSIFLRRILSAKAIYSTDSFSTPGALISSRCISVCLASTTVIIESNLYSYWMIGSMKKVWATGEGSANPVVSIRISQISWVCKLALLGF